MIQIAQKKDLRCFGFTLVEVMVVIAIITTAGIILTDIFFRSLRGGNKAEILSRIKQNGQTVLDILDKKYRSIESVTCISFLGKTIVVFNQGVYTRFRFTPPVPSQNPTKNGYISKDHLQDCNAPTPANAEVLTDNHPLTGVSVTAGSFQLQRQPGYKDIVVVNFKVGPAVAVPIAVASQLDPVIFTTTVGLR